MSAHLIETSDPTGFLAQHRMEYPEARGLDPQTAGGDKVQLVMILVQVEGIAPDARVGDGRAPRVAYLFEGASKLTGVALNADGSTYFERTWNTAGKGRGAFEWQVDAPDASGTLASSDVRFASLLGRSHIAVWDLVKPDQGNAYWQVGILRATPAPGWTDDPHMDGDAPDYCELGPATVDATTGAILSPGSLYTRGAGKGTASRCDD